MLYSIILGIVMWSYMLVLSYLKNHSQTRFNYHVVYKNQTVNNQVIWFNIGIFVLILILSITVINWTTLIDVLIPWGYFTIKNVYTLIKIQNQQQSRKES